MDFAALARLGGPMSGRPRAMSFVSARGLRLVATAHLLVCRWVEPRP